MEFTHEQVLARLAEANLIDAKKKPISMAAFKKLADIHKYGKNYKIIYVGHPKQNLFGFYSSVLATNPEALKEAHEWLVELVEGNMTSLGGHVFIGNCGIPISYGKLRFIESKN